MTNRWIEADELQIPTIQGQERFKLFVLRRVRFRRGRGFKPGARFTLANATFPHEVGHPTSATPDLILFPAIDLDQFWMD